MTNLQISSINVLGLYPDGKPDIEISGAWIGDNNPPRILKNFYRNEEDKLLQDIFHQSEVTRESETLPYYTLGSRHPAGYQKQIAQHCLVSYRFATTADVTPVEIVSDFIFGQDDDEYTTWNLLGRQEK